MLGLYDYPEYYEILFNERNIQKECTFLLQLFKSFSKLKVHKILDIACGTGVHMQELIKLGFKVAGLDNSAKMLKFANKKLMGGGKLISWYNKDMSNFSLPEHFDACICMINSLEILTQNSQFISHFQSVANCLKKGGLYIIELDNPTITFNNTNEFPKTYEKEFAKDKIKIKIKYTQLGFDTTSFLESNKMILEIEDDDNKISLEDNSPIRRITPTDVHLFSIIKQNFEIIKIFGDFSLNSTINDPNSQKMILVLKRI